jgi:mycofactocin precursor
MDHEQSIEAGRDELDHAAGEQSVEVVEELLIEEISIDGMCGVY